jgi:hypothetical protein
MKARFRIVIAAVALVAIAITVQASTTSPAPSARGRARDRDLISLGAVIRTDRARYQREAALRRAASAARGARHPHGKVGGADALPTIDQRTGEYTGVSPGAPSDAEVRRELAEAYRSGRWCRPEPGSSRCAP